MEEEALMEKYNPMVDKMNQGSSEEDNSKEGENEGLSIDMKFP